MSEQQSILARGESRWPAVITILFVLTVLELLPGRVRIMPTWFPMVAAILLIVPMIGMSLSRSDVFFRTERVLIYAFVVILIVLMILSLERLIFAIFSPSSATGGNALLASAIEIWIVNVLTFALLYWQIDRGGPELRSSEHPRPPDLIFPESSIDEGRIYKFIDYLFFAFTTSTAFSPTEMFPRSTRLKLLTMIQSTISIITVIVVASRAINVLK